jgi:hypothetical protein
MLLRDILSPCAKRPDRGTRRRRTHLNGLTGPQPVQLEDEKRTPVVQLRTHWSLGTPY